MENRYITKEKEVLTRVTLHVEDGNDYKVESMYSDESLLELAILCIEAYLTDLGITRYYMAKVIDSILSGNNIISNGTPADISCKFSFIFEQYDKRNTVTINNSYGNIVVTLINALKSCAVLATWCVDTINDFLHEYADELFDAYDDENKSIEE